MLAIAAPSAGARVAGTADCRALALRGRDRRRGPGARRPGARQPDRERLEHGRGEITIEGARRGTRIERGATAASGGRGASVGAPSPAAGTACGSLAPSRAGTVDAACEPQSMEPSRRSSCRWRPAGRGATGSRPSTSGGEPAGPGRALRRRCLAAWLLSAALAGGAAVQSGNGLGELRPVVVTAALLERGASLRSFDRGRSVWRGGGPAAFAPRRAAAPSRGARPPAGCLAPGRVVPDGGQPRRRSRAAEWAREPATRHDARRDHGRRRRRTRGEPNRGRRGGGRGRAASPARVPPPVARVSRPRECPSWRSESSGRDGARERPLGGDAGAHPRTGAAG